MTRWTDSTELLMEYPALRQGEESRFVIHLTDLNSFEPIQHGQVGVRLDHGEGSVENFSVDHPVKPGVFEILVVPARSGVPAMSVNVQAPSFLDTHDLGPTPVRRGGDSASTAPSGADEPVKESAVVFVKEQQWTSGLRHRTCASQFDAGKLVGPGTDRASHRSAHGGQRAGSRAIFSRRFGCPLSGR